MQKISVLSWNVQGHRHRGLVTPFKKILPVLERETSDILCLQEMPDALAKLRQLPTLHQYQIFIPRLNAAADIRTDGFNHNVLLSKYPITAASELIFPHFGKTRVPFESAIKADIQIGQTSLRLYICHLMINGSGTATRLKQLKFILADALDCRGPIIICGDMNIAVPKHSWARKLIQRWHGWPKEDAQLEDYPGQVDEKIIFHQKVREHGFRESLDLNRPTWSPLRSRRWELFKLKLDWFLVKNLEVVDAGLHDYVSDHRAVSVSCEL